MENIKLETSGQTDIVEITGRVQEIITRKKVGNGIVHLFVIGSTASLTTCEDDKNLYQDIKELLEDIIPYKKNWRHHQTWNDDNGAAHLRASIIGPSLCVPVKSGKLLLGTWQKIILIDFDTHPRTREIIVSITKE
jgi:secondary thiamine-phosphate synthase enzyme